VLRLSREGTYLLRMLWFLRRDCRLITIYFNYTTRGAARTVTWRLRPEIQRPTTTSCGSAKRLIGRLSRQDAFLTRCWATGCSGLHTVSPPSWPPCMSLLPYTASTNADSRMRQLPTHDVRSPSVVSSVCFVVPSALLTTSPHQHFRFICPSAVAMVSRQYRLASVKRRVTL